MSDLGRFRAKRRRGKLDDPLPWRRVVVNGMSASNVSEERSLAILRSVADHADQIEGVEFANLDTHRHDPLDAKVWQWVHDPTSPDRAGCFLAVRRSRGRILRSWYRVGVRPFLGRRRAVKMRTRWLLVAKVARDPGTKHRLRRKVVVAHAPPKRNWFLTGAFMASVRSRNADDVGGDMNRLAPFVSRALGRRARGIHVLAAVSRKWVPASGPKALHGVKGNPDHVPFVVTEFPER